MTKNIYEFNERIHTIIINPYLSKEDIDEKYNVVKKYNIKNISTTLNFLENIRDKINNQELNINVLLSYPFGDLPANFIKELILYANDAGANGIEYIPNFLSLSEKGDDIFASELENIFDSELPITLIFNKTKLTKEIFERAINIALEIGITRFQFGDGFGAPISSSDMEEIVKLLGKNFFIKIVGGIGSLEQVIGLFNLGADCIGTANVHEIFKEIKSG